MLKKLIQFTNWFNRNFGWFFTNGNKRIYAEAKKAEEKRKHEVFI